MRYNPKHVGCMLDENLVGVVKLLGCVDARLAFLRKMLQHSHPSTMSLRLMEHYAALACLTWLGKHVLAD